ncbi:hypothetical protein ACIBG4_40865 [Nonomuraea sp. NPDC050383]
MSDNNTWPFDKTDMRAAAAIAATCGNTVKEALAHIADGYRANLADD